MEREKSIIDLHLGNKCAVADIFYRTGKLKSNCIFYRLLVNLQFSGSLGSPGSLLFSFSLVETSNFVPKEKARIMAGWSRKDR